MQVSDIYLFLTISFITGNVLLVIGLLILLNTVKQENHDKYYGLMLYVFGQGIVICGIMVSLFQLYEMRRTFIKPRYLEKISYHISSV